MTRTAFLKLMATLPLGASSLSSSELSCAAREWPDTPKMPVLFLGHGSPMNAIEENEFVAGFRRVGQQLPHPRAILCVSAHWETQGTYVTAMAQPRTIHDFGGFPQALYQQQYPAPGAPDLAETAKSLITDTEVGLDHHWGLDHGAWSVIKHLYPNANVPVVQLSLDRRQTPRRHYEIAQQLSVLRRKGVLIIGSGNIVHNLRMLAWNKLQEAGYAFDWAKEANDSFKQWMLAGNHDLLFNYANQGRAFQLAVPTPEHYLPLLYALALQEDSDEISFFNDQAIGGSLTMTSVKIY